MGLSGIKNAYRTALGYEDAMDTDTIDLSKEDDFSTEDLLNVADVDRDGAPVDDGKISVHQAVTVIMALLDDKGLLMSEGEIFDLVTSVNQADTSNAYGGALELEELEIIIEVLEEYFNTDLTNTSEGANGNANGVQGAEITGTDVPSSERPEVTATLENGNVVTLSADGETTVEDPNSDDDTNHDVSEEAILNSGRSNGVYIYMKDALRDSPEYSDDGLNDTQINILNAISWIIRDGDTGTIDVATVKDKYDALYGSAGSSETGTDITGTTEHDAFIQDALDQLQIWANKYDNGYRGDEANWLDIESDEVAEVDEDFVAVS